MDENIELFLQDCYDFEDDIISLSTSLNEEDVNQLNINMDINMLINAIKGLKEYRDNLDLDEKSKGKVNGAFDKLKGDLVDLKNKHIHIYNNKVDYINNRINFYTTKLDIDMLSQEVVDLINKLSVINRCDVYVDGRWDQNGYLETLDYDKLSEAYDIVLKLDDILKIRTIEPLELFSDVNYVENTVRKIRREMNDELSLPSINTNLDVCVTLLERVTDLDIKRELMRDKLSKEMFSKYSSKINRLRDEIKEVEKKLLDRKSNLIKKSNYYAMIYNELDQINNKYDMLSKKVLEYEEKCTEKTVNVLNNYLDHLRKSLFVVQDKIREYDERGMLNQEQLNNIYKKLSEIAEKHKNINIKSNYEPILLKEDEREKSTDSKLIEFNKMLDDLDKKVNGFKEVIKDKNVRREMDELIKDREEKLEGFVHLLEYYRVNEPEKYETLKVEVDKLKDKFDRVSSEYNKKCPLRVKAVRSIKKLYKENKKIGLISAGLATLALLSSTTTLIPAIMHGNNVIAKAVPSLKGVKTLFNKILGGIIRATMIKDGVWKLANGTVLNANVAITSLLKSLATFSVGVVAFVSPAFVPQLIVKVKELANKIKSYELKEKLVQGYEKGKDKVKEKSSEIKEKIEYKREEKETKMFYDALYDKYCKHPEMTLDEFAVEYKLSDKDKIMLGLMEREEELKELKNQTLNEVISRNNSRRK